MRRFIPVRGIRHDAEAAPGGRPELLRRLTLATNARILIAASLLLSPAAVWGGLQGVMLPLVLIVLGGAVGILSLALCYRRQYERAAAGQVYGTLLVGLVLAVADPGIADFGLAIALLGPVHASLLARSPVKKRAWVLLVGVVTFAALGSAGLVYWPEGYRPEFGLVGAIAFGLIAVIVAHSASRLNSAFEVYERAQINAYKHLIEHVQDAVMRFSPNGQVLFASRSSETLFGCRRYELSGNGLLERIHVLDRPAYLTAFAEANIDGKSRTVEVRMRRDDPRGEARAQSFIWVEAALSPVTDPESRAGRHEVVALLRDITERKDIETEMREARRAAEDASRAKSRFLAIIGHELRTPLNAIVGFSEMMTSGVVGDLTPAHKEYAQLINQSGHHLIDVVRMLLDMSRLEAGKFEIHTEPFAPETLVAPCVQIVESMAKSRGVHIVVDPARNLPQVTADERACRQILINLLSNAIKFSHDGGEVTVSLKRQGTWLKLSVADRGIGMAPELAGRVGEPFFQGQDGLARQYEGTGLGLSIVKGLVELHDGQLHVQSVEGDGTTMTVLLPINGPATKLNETRPVTQLHPEPAPEPMSEWRDGKRKAL